MIEVVAAVIVRADHILLTQRRAGKDYPWTWESPGGVVEAGETHEGALRRELREEIDCEVGSFPELALWAGEFKNAAVKHKHVRISFYALSLAPANTSACKAISAHMRLGW